MGRRKSRTPLAAAVDLELARIGLFRRDLARKLKVPDTTLSDWLGEVHPGPEDLAARIEAALHLAPGLLQLSEKSSD